jgi:hypothetical protein
MGIFAAEGAIVGVAGGAFFVANGAGAGEPFLAGGVTEQAILFHPRRTDRIWQRGWRGVGHVIGDLRIKPGAQPEKERQRRQHGQWLQRQPQPNATLLRKQKFTQDPTTVSDMFHCSFLS